MLLGLDHGAPTDHATRTVYYELGSVGPTISPSGPEGISKLYEQVAQTSYHHQLTLMALRGILCDQQKRRKRPKLGLWVSQFGM